MCARLDIKNLFKQDVSVVSRVTIKISYLLYLVCYSTYLERICEFLNRKDVERVMESAYAHQSLVLLNVAVFSHNPTLQTRHCCDVLLMLLVECLSRFELQDLKTMFTFLISKSFNNEKLALRTIFSSARASFQVMHKQTSFFCLLEFQD